MCIQHSSLFSTERLYQSVHGSSKPQSNGGGVSRCPFRAALQSNKSVHTSATGGQIRATEKIAEKPFPPVQQEEEEKSECGARQSASDVHCKCAAQGLQPIS